jgi:hypothetical protein
MARNRTAAPAFLVCEIKVEKGIYDNPDYETRSWYTLDNQKDVDDLAATFEKPGFGTTYRSVRYEVYRIETLAPVVQVDVPPLTVKDHALRFGTDRRVDVQLRGKGWDPTVVYWDARGNSFAVFTPPPSLEGEARTVSDQGVVLVSINGIGEVRWAVHRTDAGYEENREAVAHFGLTWSR